MKLGLRNVKMQELPEGFAPWTPYQGAAQHPLGAYVVPRHLAYFTPPPQSKKLDPSLVTVDFIWTYFTVLTLGTIRIC
jgi:hypothetical protein